LTPACIWSDAPRVLIAELGDLAAVLVVDAGRKPWYGAARCRITCILGGRRLANSQNLERILGSKIVLPSFMEKGGDSLFQMKCRRPLSLWLLIVSLTLVLTACATSPADSDGWRESQSEVLKSRAEARWAGLINGDFDKAYSFLSPDYRSVVSLQQYRGKFGRAMNWRLAHAKDISYDSPTVASVLVEVTYRVGLMGSAQPVESTRLMTEKWLYKDGGWWYTDQ
jgi:hypothetical protein